MHTLKTPTGESAEHIDPIQLLLLWAKEYQTCGKEVIEVHMGKPCCQLNSHVVTASLKYWSHHAALAEKSSSISTNSADGHEPILRAMADGFNQFYWYYPEIKNRGLEIKPDNILPTQGGAGGLRIMFDFLRDKYPEGYILTTRAHYPLYRGLAEQNQMNLLYFDDILETSSHLSNASSMRVTLKQAIEEAKSQKQHISALLFCNPHNPLGTVISFQEWECIKEIWLEIKTNQKEPCYIICDEAYIELDFSKECSLLEFIYTKFDTALTSDPNCKAEHWNNALFFLEHSILLRSGTKGLSGAALRMAVLISFSDEIIKALSEKNDSVGRVPRSIQVAYASAINHFHGRRIDSKLTGVKKFYEPQVRYVEEALRRMGTACRVMVEGTFYVLADFKCLLGLAVQDEIIQKKLQKIGLLGDKLYTDQDIAYYFLVSGKTGIMMAPFSCFGGDPYDGLLRITCSDGKTILDKVLDTIGLVITTVKNTGCLPVFDNELENKTSYIPKNSLFFLNTPMAQKSLAALESPKSQFFTALKFFWEKMQHKLDNVTKLTEKNKKRKKPDENELFLLIDDIVALQASLNYTNPYGHETCRIIMAQALNRWYGFNDIKESNILLFSVHPMSLIKEVFLGGVFGLNEEIVNTTPNERSATLLAHLHELSNIKDKNRLQSLVIKIGNKCLNPNHFIIIDESFVENDVDATRPLGKNSLMHHLYQEFRDKILLFRSSLGVFSGEHEVISTFMTHNEVIGDLLGASIRAHGHAPIDLQVGYAYGMEACINVLLNQNENYTPFMNSMKKLCRPYVDFSFFNKNTVMPHKNNLNFLIERFHALHKNFTQTQPQLAQKDEFVRRILHSWKENDIFYPYKKAHLEHDIKSCSHNQAF